MNEFIVTFQNTHTAMQAHKTVRKHYPECQLIPLPRALGNDCGLVLLIEESNLKNIRKLLEGNAISFENLYEKIETAKGAKYDKKS
jgi:hypothetical protein